MSVGLTSPRLHFDTEVRPPVEQYLSDPGVEWKAKCAAVALTSLIEWTYEYLKCHRAPDMPGSSNDFRKRMIHRCGAIQPVLDVADAMRHRILTKNLSERIVRRSTDAWIPDHGTLKLVAPSTQYDGQSFDKVAQEVLEFWDRWIRENTE